MTQRRKRCAALEADPEAWFAYYFPGYAYAPPAQFHVASTQRILDNAEWCEVRMWSRELAKSTRTMMEVMYLTLVGHKSTEARLRKRCVLMISSTLDSAERLLQPYRNALEHNKRLITDYGMQKGETWTTAEFITTSGISFRAIGAGQSPRGTRNEEVRPDVLLFDDVDTDADCLNKSIIAKKWRWIEEAAIGTRSVSAPATIIFCGNRIANDCCIARATDIADHTDIRNIRDEQGMSVWPQKNTEEHIARVLQQKSYAAQQKEYFNNPVTEGKVFEALQYKPSLRLTAYSKLVCYTDPSYKQTSDYKATVLVGLYGKEYHIIKCFVEQTTTAQLIDWHFQIMDLVGACKCDYYIEEVFMQDVIVREVQQARDQYNRYIPVKGDRRKKQDKYTRIEGALEPLVRGGLLFLNAAEQYNPHMKRLQEQFALFAPGSRAHDDGPDAVEGAVWKLAEQIDIRAIRGVGYNKKLMDQKRY